jgi:hypothetical protein
LLSSADKDALVPGLLDPTGDDAWGAGRLNVYRALYGEPPPQGNQPPQAALVVYEQEGQVTLDAADSADPEGELLWYRFDLDYDGVWDTPWSQEAVEVLPFEVDPGQTYTARVQVVDGFGASAGALFKWPDPSVTPPEPGEDMGGAGRWGRCCWWRWGSGCGGAQRDACKLAWMSCPTPSGQFWGTVM